MITIINEYIDNVDELQKIDQKLIQKFYDKNKYTSIKYPANDLTKNLKIFTMQSGKIYYNGKHIDSNYIFQFAPSVIDFIPENVKENTRTLVISRNGNMSEAILMTYKTTKVDLFVIELDMIGNFQYLKLKYSDRIKIFFGFMKFSTNILNYLKQWYDAIIIDSGRISTSDAEIVELLPKLPKYLNKHGSLTYMGNLPTSTNSPVYQEIIKLHDKFERISNGLVYKMANKIIFSIRDKENIFGVFHLYSHNFDKTADEKTFKNELNNSWTMRLERIKTVLIGIKQQIGGKKEKLYRWASMEPLAKTLPELQIDKFLEIKYNPRSRDFQPRCHWGQMKLLMSEIQFLNKVQPDKNINPKTTLAVYVGAASGSHLSHLYKLFPDYDWLLIDPNTFSHLASAHPRKTARIMIRNEYFTDDTIKIISDLVNDHNYSDTIFISDIRVDTKEELVMKDMIKQAEWGMMMNSKHMLLKFRLPYSQTGNETTEDSIKLPHNLDPYSGIVSKSKMVSSKTNASENEITYLDGILNLQIFPPIHSTELRLHVIQNIDGTYNFKNYDFVKIENQLFFYNTFLRMNYQLTYDLAKKYNIPIEDMVKIKGIDDGYESYMVYKIMDDYHNMNKIHHASTNNQSSIELTNDLMISMERITKRDTSKCVIQTYENLLSSRNYSDEEKTRIKMWMDFVKHVHSNSNSILELVNNTTLTPVLPLTKN